MSSPPPASGIWLSSFCCRGKAVDATPWANPARESSRKDKGASHPGRRELTVPGHLGPGLPPRGSTGRLRSAAARSDLRSLARRSPQPCTFYSGHSAFSLTSGTRLRLTQPSWPRRHGGGLGLPLRAAPDAGPRTLFKGPTVARPPVSFSWRGVGCPRPSAGAACTNPGKLLSPRSIASAASNTTCAPLWTAAISLGAGDAVPASRKAAATPGARIPC